MKIAIDLDDTISRVDRVSRPLGYITRNQLPFRLIDENAQAFVRVFDWGMEDVLRFFRAGGISAFTEAELRPFAKEVISAWRKAGHEITILTARSKEMFQNPEKLTRDWLEKRKIPYDKLVIEKDKGAYCAEHGIDLFLDNDVENCLAVQARGICTILMVSQDSLFRAHEVGFTCANWKRVKETVEKIERIRDLEGRSARACASRGLELFDGWELHHDVWPALRGNSVRVASPSRYPLVYKVATCEEKYAKWGEKCCFLLTSLDFELDRILRARGYLAERNCAMMTLEQIPEFPAQEGVTLYDELNEQWLLDYQTIAVGEGVRDFTAAHGKVLFAMIECDGQPATALTAVLEGEWLGIYDVHTAPNFRRRGFAKKALSAMLKKGKELGATRAYLQVRASNYAAEALYSSLGFERRHEYWYRSKKLR